MALATVGLVTAIGGAAVSAGSKVAQGVIANDQANQQANELTKQAIEQRERTDIRLQRLKKEEGRFLGDQTAAISAAGVEVSGSALSNLADTTESFREERQDIQRTSEFEVEQLLKGAQGARKAGRQALATGIVGGFASGLSSFGNIGSKRGLFDPKTDQTQVGSGG